MSGSAPCVEAPKVRRNWLAKAVLTAAALSVPVAAMSATAQAATWGSGQQKPGAEPKSHESAKPEKAAPEKQYVGKHRRSATYNQVAAAVAKTLEGDPYTYGGTSPAGFDCSGLTQYVYLHTGHGKLVRRTAEDQFLQFKPISQSDAKPGDLVFFHETSDPGSYVYHVGVYEGGDDMVAATTYGEGVQFQSFTWAGDTVTFGSITD
jgi:cell wall-associated NlpC family hydrolase